MQEFLLNQLKYKNPKAYEQIKNMMSSGKNPDEVLNDLLNRKIFTQSQLDQVKKYVKR